MKTILPNSNFVFATPDEAKTKTDSGFQLSESSRDEPKTAVVVSVGDSVVGFKAGDRIVYKDYTTTDINLDGTTHVMLEHLDIMGKIVEQKD